MKTRKRLLLLAILLLLVVAVVMINSRPTGPVYEGKRLSQWLNALEQARGEDDAAEAKQAIRGLGTNALPHLVAMLSARDPVWKPVWNGVMEKLSWTHWRVRTAAEKRTIGCAAISLLGSTAAPAIPQLSNLLTRPETATEAVLVLGEIGPASLPVLTAACTNRNSLARAQMVHTVARVSGDSPALRPLLLDCLDDADIEVRCAALRALGGRRAEADAVLPALLPLLTDANPRVRRNAAESVGRLRSDVNGSVPALLPLLADPDWLVRKSALQALAAFGSEADAAVPSLLARIASGFDFSELSFAMQALKRIAPQLAMEVAGGSLQSTNAFARQMGALTLGGFGWRAASYAPALRQLQSRDLWGRVRAAAEDALDQIEKSQRAREKLGGVQWREGGVIQGATDRKLIALLFAGHEHSEGGDPILNELAKRNARASFFLTGDFLTRTNFAVLVRRLIREGHYLGPHSDRHRLGCSRDEARRTLLSSDEFTRDLLDNLAGIERFGVPRNRAAYFLPPYGHYNEDLAAWTEEMGMTLISFTPGTRSPADDTGEADPHFVSTQAILDSIATREREEPQGLNGFLLFLHLGSGPGRTDKFHARLGELLDSLFGKGYQFVRVDELLETGAGGAK